MNITSAIQSGKIDAGIGLENVQMVELEEWLKGAGEDPAQVKMLRIDELAELGCCCFCSILCVSKRRRPCVGRLCSARPPALLSCRRRTLCVPAPTRTTR